MDKLRKPVFSAGTLIALAFLLFAASPAFADLKGIATLYSFSGDIVMKSDGVWGVDPKSGMPVYHGDKFCTKEDSFIRVRFHDGSFLDLLPNTNARVAEIIGDEGLSAQRDKKKREIRVFVGKIVYRSSPNSVIKTKLVAPKAVAEVVEDSKTRFGTDGDLAFINWDKKGETMKGDIIEGKVPQALTRQAEMNENYQSAVAAARIRQEYIDAVKSLLAYRNVPDGILLALNDTSLLPLILAQTRAQKRTADKVLELGARYSVKNNENLLIENRSLRQNPDLEVRERAMKGEQSTQKSFVQAQQALDSAIQTGKDIEKLAKQALTGDSKQISEALKSLKPVISGMIEKQKSVNAVALGKEKVSDYVTAGLVGDPKKIEEKEIAESKEEVQAEIGNGGNTEELLRRKLEEKTGGGRKDQGKESPDDQSDDQSDDEDGEGDDSQDNDVDDDKSQDTDSGDEDNGSGETGGSGGSGGTGGTGGTGGSGGSGGSGGGGWTGEPWSPDPDNKPYGQ